MEAWLHDAINAEAATAPEPPAAVPVVPGRVVHVDGDYLAYFAAGGDEMPVGIARRVCAERIESFREMSGAASAVLHLTTSGSTKGERFLASTVKDYQGHRAGKKPKNWQAMRDYLEHSEYATFKRAMWADREADDGIALASEQGDIVIATRDKDMRMLPGIHVDWLNYTEVVVPRGAYEVIGDVDGLVYGHKWFWLQMLQGDTADNIPGLPKFYGKQCGPATAEKALAGTTCNAEAFDVVSRAYHAHYDKGWSDRMAEQACLLWLRTDSAASPDNFLGIVPLPKAAARLMSRIGEQRATIDKLNARAAAQEDGCAAGQ
ncbi:exonuclease [Ralstonia phage RS-PII-1]|uniref:Exonuclease n=1 Tax=Ralstonia phage RS-PII-1 TaxID=1932892 RepID=A0A1L7DQH5_9CAUD|nr:exonuclease [Ralstonia phage RS-PII-1]APU00315.1 exonuclease [Ralstonia phage RS-PII-1]